MATGYQCNQGNKLSMEAMATSLMAKVSDERQPVICKISQ